MRQVCSIPLPSRDDESGNELINIWLLQEITDVRLVASRTDHGFCVGHGCVSWASTNSYHTNDNACCELIGFLTVFWLAQIRQNDSKRWKQSWLCKTIGLIANCLSSTQIWLLLRENVFIVPVRSCWSICDADLELCCCYINWNAPLFSESDPLTRLGVRGSIYTF